MTEAKKHTITDPDIIKELSESVEEYAKACKRTMEGTKTLNGIRKSTAELIFDVPEHGNEIEKWNAPAAELLAGQLGAVADVHVDQAECLRAQMQALRRLNRAVIAIRDEVQKHGTSETRKTDESTEG